jgi:hypothetical protein
MESMQTVVEVADALEDGDVEQNCVPLETDADVGPRGFGGSLLRRRLLNGDVLRLEAPPQERTDIATDAVHYFASVGVGGAHVNLARGRDVQYVVQTACRLVSRRTLSVNEAETLYHTLQHVHGMAAIE